MSTVAATSRGCIEWPSLESERPCANRSVAIARVGALLAHRSSGCQSAANKSARHAPGARRAGGRLAGESCAIEDVPFAVSEGRMIDGPDSERHGWRDEAYRDVFTACPARRSSAPVPIAKAPLRWVASETTVSWSFAIGNEPSGRAPSALAFIAWDRHRKLRDVGSAFVVADLRDAFLLDFVDADHRVHRNEAALHAVELGA
jgi:hypothetical protein